MNNEDFIVILKNSFITYLKTSARSNKKLAVLHGAISEDLYQRLNDKTYSVYSLGYENGKERKISGRYIDKAVDITVAQNETPVAGIAVKYVMSNYSQNSNNYFENMLGETANIRSARIPYFQIFAMPDTIPYFDKDGTIISWERISERNIKKYVKLSNDDIQAFMHTPNKTLVFIVHTDFKNNIADITDKQQYANYFLTNDFTMSASTLHFEFGNTIIYNDYNKFIEKVVHAIKSV